MGKAREQGFGPSLAFLYIKKENHKKIQTVCKTKVTVVKTIPEKMLKLQAESWSTPVWLWS